MYKSNIMVFLPLKQLVFKWLCVCNMPEVKLNKELAKYDNLGVNYD